MITSNPSHLLISRNPPRSLAHPQLAPTSTSRLPASPLPPPGLLGPYALSSDEVILRHPKAASLPNVRQSQSDDEEETEEEDQIVDIHPTFSKDGPMPGRVKVVVGRYEFWCHKEILWFGSPFFQALLQGSWAETNAEESVLETSPAPTDRDTDSPSPPDIDQLVPRPLQTSGLPEIDVAESLQPDRAGESEVETGYESNKASVYLDAIEDGPSVADILKELRELPDLPQQRISPILPVDQTVPCQARQTPPLPSLLQPTNALPIPPAMTSTSPSRIVTRRRRRSNIRTSFSSHRVRATTCSTRGRKDKEVDAVVELHEEDPAAFQDFLFWCYPHLECKVTWTNIENLLTLSRKLLVPPLTKLCDHFLLTHCSGRPIMALMLAEIHVNAELYREASRFVLDQANWDQEEMDCLTPETQLKLSKKRNWFLERLLKLGTIDVKKEYTCRPDCPDPSRCQTHLDEKWRQAHLAVCRYGPPQPSVAFRCLRQLETFPTNPSLIMPHTLCQSAAKSWVAILFDRMFHPKLIFSSLNPGTEKYWLGISMG